MLGPLFRRQFRSAAEENAKTQSHLVEVLTGIQTVKAQNVEMVSRWRWQGFIRSTSPAPSRKRSLAQP